MNYYTIRLGKSKFTLYFIAVDYNKHQTSEIYGFETYKYFYHNVKKFAKKVLKKKFKNNEWYKDKSVCWQAFTSYQDACEYRSNIWKTFAEIKSHERLTGRYNVTP